MELYVVNFLHKLFLNNWLTQRCHILLQLICRAFMSVVDELTDAD